MSNQEELMLEVTGAVRAELQQRLASNVDCLRLTYADPSTVRLEQDARGPSDVVLVSEADLPIVVAAPDIAATLEGAILHFHRRGDDRYGQGFVLLRPRGSAARAEWSPPRVVRPHRTAQAWHGLQSLFRRRLVSGSTTQVSPRSDARPVG
jgi:hypothetical protein